MNYYFLFGPSEAASYNNNRVVVRFIVHGDASLSHLYRMHEYHRAAVSPWRKFGNGNWNMEIGKWKLEDGK